MSQARPPLPFDLALRDRRSICLLEKALSHAGDWEGSEQGALAMLRLLCRAGAPVTLRSLLRVCASLQAGAVAVLLAQGRPAAYGTRSADRGRCMGAVCAHSYGCLPACMIDLSRIPSRLPSQHFNHHPHVHTRAHAAGYSAAAVCAGFDTFEYYCPVHSTLLALVSRPNPPAIWLGGGVGWMRWGWWGGGWWVGLVGWGGWVGWWVRARGTPGVQFEGCCTYSCRLLSLAFQDPLTYDIGEPQVFS